MNLHMRNTKRGFSLVELAIVLGVIGTVMGSIWSYAGSARQTARVEQTVEAIAATVEGVQSDYGKRADISKTSAGDVNLVPTLITDGVIPAQIVSKMNAGFADSPLAQVTNAKGTFVVCAWNYDVGGAGDTKCNLGNSSQFFAVEAVIAYTAAKDPSKVHLITANYTGSLRLFVGLGWPMVYFVALFLSKNPKDKKRPWAIELEDEHSVAILSLLPALLYFMVIYFKGTLSIFDGLVLSAIYFIYLFLLSKMPPHDKEEIEDLGRIPKYVMKYKYPANVAWIACLFIAGAAILYFSAHPFLNSMLALAVYMGISQFIFVQWVAPFLSEFPEKLSAFYWARKTNKAPMALANFVSSSINQWTILIAMIPFIYSLGMGKVSVVVFDEHQKLEILLTIVQSYLGFLFLVSMDFQFFEAAALFILWFAQFLFPGIRQEIIWVYAAWALIETVRLIKNFKERNAFRAFLKFYS